MAVAAPVFLVSLGFWLTLLNDDMEAYNGEGEDQGLLQHLNPPTQML